MAAGQICEFDVKLTDRELVCMIDEVDSDGNGCVEEEEYIRIMSLSPWFLMGQLWKVVSFFLSLASLVPLCQSYLPYVRTVKTTAGLEH